MSEIANDEVRADASPRDEAEGAERRFSAKRLAQAAIPLAVLGVFVLFELPLCPFRTLLGIPCPGCGLTRATEAMLVGDLTTMLHFHPLAPIITPLAVFGIGRATLVYAGALPSSFDPLRRVPSVVWMVMVIGLLGLWGARAFGLLGGLPDPLDPTQGWLWRGLGWVLSPIFGG